MDVTTTSRSMNKPHLLLITHIYWLSFKLFRGFNNIYAIITCFDIREISLSSLVKFWNYSECVQGSICFACKCSIIRQCVLCQQGQMPVSWHNRLNRGIVPTEVLEHHSCREPIKDQLHSHFNSIHLLWLSTVWWTLPLSYINVIFNVHGQKQSDNENWQLAKTGTHNVQMWKM